MKKVLCFILVLFFFVVKNNCSSQTRGIDICIRCGWGQYLDFNSLPDSSSYYLYYDTTQTNNIWQVGKPNKTVFTSGYFGQRALLTDTINPYSINNLSSFQFLVSCMPVNCGGVSYNERYIHFFHKMDSDQSNDGSTIEVSHDKGSTWINLIQDTLLPGTITGSIYSINDTVKSLGKPGFSGSFGWNEFKLICNPIYDTTIFRFTFASDSIQTNKDGWMIGLVDAEGWFEGIEENNTSINSISPNPFSQSTQITLPQTYHNIALAVYDIQGKQVAQQQYKDCSQIQLNRNQLSNGLYFLKLTLYDKEVETGKIVVNEE
jgi:hypothetical protein